MRPLGKTSWNLGVRDPDRPPPPRPPGSGCGSGRCSESRDAPGGVSCADDHFWTFPAGLCPGLWSEPAAEVTGQISMGGDWEPGLKGGSRTVGQERLAGRVGNPARGG